MNKWEIYVTARNQASEVFHQVTKDGKEGAKKLEDLGHATKKLGKATEVEGLGKGLVKATGAAGEFLGGITETAEALSFLGPTGALATAAVAGIGLALYAGGQQAVEFTKKWAESAGAVKTAADNIGISSKDLQKLQFAGAYNDVGADAVNQSLMGLANTLNDARFGRNNEALVAMRDLGLHLHYTKDGALDVQRAYKDLADIMARYDGRAQTQQKIAQIFGVAAAIDVLRRGSKGLSEDMARAAANHQTPFSDEQLKRSEEFKKNLQDIRNTWNGVKGDMAFGLMPFASDALKTLNWDLKHPLDNVPGGPADKFAKWLGFSGHDDHRSGPKVKAPRPSVAHPDPALAHVMILDAATQTGMANLVSGGIFGRPFGTRTERQEETFAYRIEHVGEHSRQSAVSPRGAVGVMQLMPDTARSIARRIGVPFDYVRLRTDEAYNRMLGKAETDRLLRKYRDPVLAAAAYNAGEGVIDGPYRDRKTGQWHRGWLERYGDPRNGKISDQEFAARIPFKETHDYVDRVLQFHSSQVGGAAAAPSEHVVTVNIAGLPKGSKATASGPNVTVGRVEHSLPESSP